MSLFRCGVLVLALALLAACASVAPKPSTTGTAPLELTRAGILTAINDARAAYGKPPLEYNVQLEAAARSQANLMASRDQLSHDLGVTLRQRVTDAGYNGAVGENVAGGQATLQQAINGWLASPGHRDTLLSTRFKEFGLAVATVSEDRNSRYRIYWALIAGGPFEEWMRWPGVSAVEPRTPLHLPLKGGLRAVPQGKSLQWSDLRREGQPRRHPRDGGDLCS